MNKIYAKSGFLNWDYLVDETKAFCMVVGPRGTGKTYGLLKYLVEHKERFIYLRRLKTQLDECCKQETNPFKKLNTDTGRNILPVRSASMVKFCEFIPDDRGDMVASEPICYGAALSTFATLRGADFSDVTAIVFDESVAMDTEKPIKNEFNAFLNFYETVNRNRELLGEAPVKCFLLGNANRLSNPYFMGWGFMRTAIKMITGGQMVYRSEDGSRLMVLLLKSPISERKKSTALYHNANDDFLRMAIDNAFRTDDTMIKSKPLREYTHIVSVGEIGIYRHKSNRDLYVCKVVNRSKYYEATGIWLDMFRYDYAGFRIKYFSHLITFETYEDELLFREYIGLN